MIRLLGLTHGYRSTEAADLVFDDVTVDIPNGRRIAILGSTQTGKTTLIQLLAGLQTPLQGTIERYCRVSFPAGYSRGIKPKSSMRQNIAFAAEIYGADGDEVVDYVADVSGIGHLIDEKVKDLSMHERMTFGYAMTYAIPFDTYLFDTNVSYGLPAFRDRCLAMFEERSRSACMVVATRHYRIVERLCDMAIVIDGKKLRVFDDIADGIAEFRAIDDRRNAGLSESARLVGLGEEESLETR